MVLKDIENFQGEKALGDIMNAGFTHHVLELLMNTGQGV